MGAVISKLNNWRQQTMDKFSLKWNDFQTTVSNSFKVLKQEQDFFDVTLVSDDQKEIQSHKVVLSACSSFFKPILQKNSHSHPLIYLSGIDSINLQFIIDYVYEGEVQLFQDQLDSFLNAAQKLQIDGLLENQKKDPDDPKIENVQLDNEEEEEEDDKSNFRISRTINQNQTRRIETLVDVSGYDQDEVDKKISEILIDEDDHLKCTLCGRMSMTKDGRNMRWHVETHLEGLSYLCQLCNNTFRNRKSLKNHKARVHK